MQIGRELARLLRNEQLRVLHFDLDSIVEVALRDEQWFIKIQLEVDVVRGPVFELERVRDFAWIKVVVQPEL